MRPAAQPVGSVCVVGHGDGVADAGLPLGSGVFGKGCAQLVGLFGVAGGCGGARGLVGEQIEERPRPVRAADARAKGANPVSGAADPRAGGGPGEDLHADALLGAEREARAEQGAQRVGVVLVSDRQDLGAGEAEGAAGGAWCALGQEDRFDVGADVRSGPRGFDGPMQ